MLKIKPIKDKAKPIENPKLAEMIELKHPFSLSVFGCSGSGKTILVYNLLMNPQLFYKYFDQIYIFSPTGGLDQTFENLKLPKENIITSSFVEKLDELCAMQESYRSDKLCLIFEDLTSQKKLMNSTSFLKVFCQNRHMNISTIAVCHKYNSLTRTCRLNSNHIMIFPCSLSEQKILSEEYTPIGWTKQDFSDMLREAYRPEHDMERPFLWINNKSDRKFRKSLTYSIDVRK